MLFGRPLPNNVSFLVRRNAFLVTHVRIFLLIKRRSVASQKLFFGLLLPPPACYFLEEIPLELIDAEVSLLEEVGGFNGIWHNLFLLGFDPDGLALFDCTDRLSVSPLEVGIIFDRAVVVDS